jgi:hypothetical protein
MKDIPNWTIPVAVLGTAAVLYAWMKVNDERSKNPFADKYLVKRGSDLPCIWLYYDTSEVNSRWWADFGARSSRALNMPFLNLCYDTIAKANGRDYRIEVIGGLSDLAERLGGWETLPLPLRNPQAQVRNPELNWIRAAILAKFGGLWLQPAVICLKPFGPLPDDRVIFFGSDTEQTFAGKAGTKVPSLRAIWSPMPGNPIFMEWAARAYTRLDSTNGGRQIRGDEKSDYVELALGKADIYPGAELSRRGSNGKLLQLEDLLAAGEEDHLHFDVPAETIYVPFPWPELKERRLFGWFLRMSEDQILSSDLVASTFFRSVL